MTAPAGPTELLLAWGRGDGAALDRLVPLVHDELRRLAGRYMVKERSDHTLQATALVNEAYLRLIQIRHVQWHDRAHFLAMAARVMRRILVDAARARGSGKRGDGIPSLALTEASEVSPHRPADLSGLDEALERLGEAYPRHSQVVELRFFGGLTLDETAEVLRVSRDTVKRDWQFAKLWLLRALADGRSAGIRRNGAFASRRSASGRSTRMPLPVPRSFAICAVVTRSCAAMWSPCWHMRKRRRISWNRRRWRASLGQE